MGVKFWRNWRNFQDFSKSHYYGDFFQKWSPTCPKFNTHKKVVVHFFILMQLLPKTPPSTYLKIKKFKDQKRYHFTHFTSLHFTHSLTFTSQALASLAFGSGGGGRRREEMASSLTIKESFKGKYSTCKTSVGVNPASIFQRNPFKNFFHSIFFPGKSLVKNSKLTFNFT